MLHVASPRFYKEARRRLGDCEVVVAEGVSGPSVIGSALTLTYRIIPANRKSGLVEQDINFPGIFAWVAFGAGAGCRGWLWLGAVTFP